MSKVIGYEVEYVEYEYTEYGDYGGQSSSFEHFTDKQKANEFFLECKSKYDEVYLKTITKRFQRGSYTI